MADSFFRNRVRWLLIFWIFTISAVSYLDRVNISIASRFMQQEFHISDVQLGPVFSAFLIGYTLFQAPAGRLADRFGPRRILMLGTIWWGVFTALTALVPAGISGLLFVLMAVLQAWPGRGFWQGLQCRRVASVGDNRNLQFRISPQQ